MITKIEAKNFRSLAYINQKLKGFQVLVGPNASGKTTFLDVVGFVASIIKNGIDAAIEERSANFQDLSFAGQGGDIELAIEATIPKALREHLWNDQCDTIRYEVKIGFAEELQENVIKDERVIIFQQVENGSPFDLLLFFPRALEAPASILHQRYKPHTFRQILRKHPGGNDNYSDETYREGGKGWLPSFKLGPKRSAFGNMPADSSKFPVSTWFQQLMREGIQSFVLDSQNIRKASPPAQGLRFKPDGSNLPWMIELVKKNPTIFQDWIEHLRTALPDIENIDTVERPEDRHRYLRVHYTGGITVPSWLVSDGTLRLLALTLPAYLNNFEGVYLIEEPENGIHPRAIETVFQSLTSVYKAQILLATHSPIFLNLVEPDQLICFAKTSDGQTAVVSGNEHPDLINWKHEVALSDLFGSGILG